MITLNSAVASTDVFGGHGSAPMLRSVAPISATGLSFAICANQGLAGAAAFEGTRVPATAAVLGKRREQAIAERVLAPTYLPVNDGTTLGIHSPGRPQS